MGKMILLVPFFAAVGCAHSAQVRAPQVSPRPTSMIAASNDAKEAARKPDSPITENALECGELSVHFPFNSTELGTVDRDNLERGARCLKADHAMHVRIEGNADDRGTEEYNLALGDQRATSVAHYLEALGASREQLRTVSYGKERPVCSVHDEECWSRNRRADLKLAAVR